MSQPPLVSNHDPVKTQIQQIGRVLAGQPVRNQLAIAFTLGCLVAWTFVLILIALWS